MFESNIGRKVGVWWFVIGAMMMFIGWLVGGVLIDERLAEIVLIGAGLGIVVMGFNYVVFSRPKKGV